MSTDKRTQILNLLKNGKATMEEAEELLDALGAPRFEPDEEQASGIPARKCPSCEKEMKPGFTVKTNGLSFIRPDKFEKFVFGDEDLQEVGLAKLLPVRTARYSLSFLCRACRIYVVEYGTSMSRPAAEAAAREMGKEDS